MTPPPPPERAQRCRQAGLVREGLPQPGGNDGAGPLTNPHQLVQGLGQNPHRPILKAWQKYRGRQMNHALFSSAPIWQPLLKLGQQVPRNLERHTSYWMREIVVLCKCLPDEE